jgi:hypothetical protein
MAMAGNGRLAITFNQPNAALSAFIEWHVKSGLGIFVCTIKEIREMNHGKKKPRIYFPSSNPVVIIQKMLF